MKWTIQKKLVLAFLALAVIPAGLVGLHNYWMLQETLREKIGQGLQQQAAKLMEDVDRTIYERYQNVEIWSRDPVMANLTQGDPKSVEDFLKMRRRFYKFYDEIFCVDSLGNVIASSNPARSGTNVLGQAWYQRFFAEGKIVVHNLIRFKETGEYGLFISAPVQPENLTPAEQTKGALPKGEFIIAHMNWSEIVNMVNTMPVLQEIGQDETAYAMLMNKDGFVLTQPYFEEEQIILKQNLKHHGLRAAQLSIQGQSGFVLEKGVRRRLKLIGFAPSQGYQSYEGLGWSALVFQDARHAFQPIKVLQKQIFITMLIVCLIAAALGIIFGYRFAYPIRTLAKVAVDIRRNHDLSRRVHIRSNDEIGQLFESFNAMVGDLDRHDKDRKNMEQAMLQSEKMAAVGQLAGGVAHEINNPLGVILGFAQGVVKRLPSGDALEMPLKSIEREALRCKQLVQDLLIFSRVGKTDKDHTNLSEAIEGALSLVLTYAKTKNIQLVKELTADIPTVLVNQSQIQQVIVNLSNNAMDAMPGGGTLTVRTKHSVLNGKEAVEIQVQDTGQGIPKEIQAKIFEPFFTTKEVGKGTGLGLSLVYEIIQRHEGRIDVESEIGKGTLFRICLPIH